MGLKEINAKLRGSRPAKTAPKSAPESTPENGSLKRCRCRDCHCFRPSPNGPICDEQLGGTKVIWETGERIVDPDPNQWIHCTKYRSRNHADKNINPNSTTPVQDR